MVSNTGMVLMRFFGALWALPDGGHRLLSRAPAFSGVPDKDVSLLPVRRR
ncbi:Hypothetical protein GbCGDNIH9_7011 [Granulibacter bethesdensis]|uniref:Uncharacterized protein n=1 Tax=Granulibacter bethesdensis TaxID=364410 RepID=A0AAC9P7Y7_9PROT|nr:Hypothetical protein GbCGDNIH9_7011 [Granulibacter bethesdensis]APH61012.1 Hypothetical protein GbCGDNIH8_7011 [Granulibacter bethesdensis]